MREKLPPPAEYNAPELVVQPQKVPERTIASVFARDVHIGQLSCARCGRVTRFVIEYLRPDDVLECYFCNHR